jgi:hypothetical protein
LSDEPGFSIGTEFYPFPSSFRLGDPVLVAEVTGISWNEFAEMLDDGDPRTLAGLVAVAVWQKNPGWRRERVLRYVEALEMDALQFQGDVEGDAGPPGVAGDSGITEHSPATSTSSSDEKDPSEETPEPIGLQQSEIVAA